ncbi:MAG: aminopeptidase [Saprospiraceae bacterium]
MLDKYANLLVNYSLSIKEGDRLCIRTTTLAEPLVREIYRSATKAGAHVEVIMDFDEKSEIFMAEGNEEQMKWVSPLTKLAFEEFEAYLVIRAPYESKPVKAGLPNASTLIAQAHESIQTIYSKRTASRELKRSLCQYPTESAAKTAGMSLEEYTSFIFHACKLDQEDPIKAWLKVRDDQQAIVDCLNKSSTIQYLGPNIDLTFSTKGRLWINSDGQTNMPSGEVYTSPVEDSVNGFVYYTFPSIYGGREVKGIRLEVKDGLITNWEAESGKDYLDNVFQIPGARRFGEAAIGTNYEIDRMTRNILFDEKIGGTVHLAIGQSYLQTGGLNQSSIHWDMITDMKNGGKIMADGKMIYENGLFLLNQ